MRLIIPDSFNIIFLSNLNRKYLLGKTKNDVKKYLIWVKKKAVNRSFVQNEKHTIFAF
jgi:hypothetical protein